MARVATIQDADGELGSVDLVTTGATGLAPRAGSGFGRSTFVPNQLDEGPDIDNLLFVERWTLRLRGSSHDNVAAQEQTLIRLLRKAYRYFTDPRQKVPVYLTFQTEGETNQRFAHVYRCPELDNPRTLDFIFEQHSTFLDLGVSIARFAWADKRPGDIGSAIQLNATDGPATPQMVHIANFEDSFDLTHVKVDDGGAFTDIISAASGTDLFPAAPAVDDALYFGSTAGPWKHACVGVATAGAYTWDMLAEYWNGSTWAGVNLGDNVTVFGQGVGEAGFAGGFADNIFKAVGIWSINFIPPSDWATTSVDGVSGYWLRFRLGTVAGTTTVPEKDGSTIYAQRKNYVDIPATAFSGDAGPIPLMRFYSPSGGDENESPALTNRIIAGVKSRGLTNFKSWFHANGGGGTFSAGTDASTSADPSAPSGDHVAVDFSTSESLVVRGRWTISSANAPDYEGTYRCYALCEQVGGSAGDISVRGQVSIGSTAVDTPKYNMPDLVDLEGVDEGPEIRELGDLHLPFADHRFDDVFSGQSVVLDLMATRNTGSATLRIFGVVLIPIDEWSAELDDPVADSTNGSSALRGGTGLDFDAGIIERRAQKFLWDGTNAVHIRRWNPHGGVPMFEPGRQTRIYFLIGHYPTTFRTKPLVATPGMHLAFELYGQSRWLGLRGAD